MSENTDSNSKNKNMNDSEKKINYYHKLLLQFKLNCNGMDKVVCYY